MKLFCDFVLNIISQASVQKMYYCSFINERVDVFIRSCVKLKVILMKRGANLYFGLVFQGQVFFLDVFYFHVNAGTFV